VRVSLKSVSGVDSVDVSLAKGFAAVKMKPGNTATLAQLQAAITKNGFTMKRSTATVSGTVVAADGKAQLKVSGSNEMLDLVPEADVAPTVLSLDGRAALVTGEIPETAKGKSFAIQYHSITEQ
jgi:hypothetical protein